MANKLDVRYPALGRKIKAAIAAQGTDIRGVSAALNMTYESVRRYAAGISKPRTNTLESLARLLKVTPEDFLDEESQTVEPTTSTSSSFQPPTSEQIERLESLLKLRHPEGFTALVVQPLGEGVWSRRIGNSRLPNTPQYLLAVGTDLDDLVNAL